MPETEVKEIEQPQQQPPPAEPAKPAEPGAGEPAPAPPEAPAAPAPAVPLDRDTVAEMVLNDKHLPEGDYLEARNNQEFLDTLVDEYAAAHGITLSDAKPAEKAESKPPAGKPEAKPAASEPPRPRARGGFQRKIDGLTRKNYDLERKLQQEHELRLEAERKAAGEKPAGGGDQLPAKAERPKPPRAENFQTVPEYEAARDQYQEELAKFIAGEQVEQALAEQRRKDQEWLEQRRRQQAQTEEQAAMTERVAGWEKQRKAAGEKHGDFEEVLLESGLSDLPIEHPVALAITDSEIAGELAYWLGTHPEELERIAGLAPIKLLREVGRIEAGILGQSARAGNGASGAKPPEQTKTATKPAAKTSSAPPPITPVGGSSKPATEPGEIPIADYVRGRNAGTIR